MSDEDIRKSMTDPSVRGQHLAAIRNRGKDVLINDLVAVTDLLVEISEQLEAAQRERDEYRELFHANESEKQTLFHQKDMLLTANLNAGKRADAAEAEIKRRDAQEPVLFHMGEAMRIFDAIKGSQLSRRVDNAQLGAMGATEVQEWSCKIGGKLEMHSSNGGCTLKAYAASPAVALPPELASVIERLTHEAQHITAWHYIDEHSCKVNRRDLIALTEAVKALACQPDKVVKLPKLAYFEEDECPEIIEAYIAKDMRLALDAAGVKWEESE